jgi:hypothetical protein
MQKMGNIPVVQEQIFKLLKMAKHKKKERYASFPNNKIFWEYDPILEE